MEVTDNTEVVINLLKGIDEITKKYEEKKDILESFLNDPELSEQSKLLNCGELWMCKKILRDLKELKK